MRAKIRRKGARWYLSIIDRSGREQAHGGYRTKREAQARAAELVSDSRRGRYTAPGKLTVAQYLMGWVGSLGVEDISVGTRDLYELTVRSHIIPHVGDVPLQELGTSDLRRLYATLRASGGRGGRPLRGKSVRNVHGLLSKALGDAVRHEPPLLAVNPARSVGPPPRDDSVDRQAWTKDEVHRFLDVAAEDRLGGIWRLALATGLRRGELLGLQWSDVDAESVTVRRQVLVRIQQATGARLYVRGQTKSRRHRRVRFDEGTMIAFAGWKKVQAAERLAFGPAWKKDGGLGVEAPWVVTEPDGSVVRPGTLTARFRRLAKLAGVPELPFHGVRHSYATLALNAGVRLDIVSRQLGHGSVAITADVYTHDDDEAGAEAAEKMATVLEGR